MKSINKLYIILITLFISTFVVSAQNDDEIEFSPIHSTILPGDGFLKIEEQYGKKSSVYLVGDELMFKSKKFETSQVSFNLPVNPAQDYTLEFSFKKPKMKFSILAIGVNDYALSFTQKFARVVLANGRILFSNDKWKLPKGSDKDELICKIVKKKNNVTFFINNQYLCETQVKNIPNLEGMEVAINFSSIKGEMLLKSIRVDQGPDTED